MPHFTQNMDRRQANFEDERYGTLKITKEKKPASLFFASGWQFSNRPATPLHWMRNLVGFFMSDMLLELFRAIYLAI